MKSVLARQNERLAALYAIAFDLLTHHEMDEVLDTIIVRASELLDAPIGFLDLLDGDTLVTKSTTEPVLSAEGDRTPLKRAALTAKSIRLRRPQLVNNYLARSKRIKKFDPYHLRAACTFPIMIDNKAVGALSLGRTKPNYPFTMEDIETMQALAQLAALAFQNANLFEETQKKSITDGLTGLANRNRFDDFLAQEWTRAMRTREPLALIMADIDSFKKYNDTYGHAAGDECLRSIAREMQKVARRASDLAARYGGEELAIILPATHLADAKRMAEELRSYVEALGMPHASSETKPWVTICAGVAAMIPKRAAKPLMLINLADQALYKAKREGKNCVRVSHARLRKKSAHQR
jgi:diguanylate cyclase (GGDEF)-like protein